VPSVIETDARLACRVRWRPGIGPWTRSGSNSQRTTGSSSTTTVLNLEADAFADPGMYGEQTSTAAVHAASVFRAAEAAEVLELGAGHGRDALYFAREGFTVHATDFSATGLEQLRQAAHAQDTDRRVRTTVHDVREPLALPDASVDAVFAPWA
jgi:hypothetical protein